MNTVIRNFAFLLIPLVFGLFSCDEELPNVTGKNHLYELKSISEQDIDGHMKIRQRNDGSTQIELVLNNLGSNDTYPAYLHFNNALEGGGVALTLTPVDGNSQNSVTEVTELDSGQPITYDELKSFDGHINVQLGNDPGAVVAQADIGMNALTGRFQQFTLQEGDVANASGIVTVEERESGFSLITVEVEGSIEGKQHPVTLNFGSIYDSQGQAGTFNPVDGSTGLSHTHVENLDGELVAHYNSLVEFNGFVRVHLGTGAEMNTVLVQGNIAYVEN